MDTKRETTKEINYISTPAGITSVMEKTGTTENMFYIHPDYLGSVHLVTNASGSAVQELSYDAWGRQRNATDWTYNGSLPEPKFERGYTFHEQLTEFDLINMNGRIYDPFIARFMSPDPFTQDPGNLQGYNRYSYVLNNPLKYVDPSGYRTISMQEAIYYLLNSSEHGGTWTSTGGGGGEVNDFSNSDHAFMAGAGYLNQHNAWGENGNNSSFKAYNAYYVSKGGKTNVKAISRNDYTLNNPGTDYFERHFDHFEFDNISNSNILFASSGGTNYTKYSDLEKIFREIWTTGSEMDKNMTELFNFDPEYIRKKGELYTITYKNGTQFTYFHSKAAIPNSFTYFSPVKGKIPFLPTNTIKENFPTSPNVPRPYAIRIYGKFGLREPSRLGTIYFSDWEAFYNFSKYIRIGE